MENIVISILSILAILLLILLCIAAVLFIIKIARIQTSYFFKNGTRLYDLAFKDDLTDLFNRNAYIRDLELLERQNFKNVWFSIFDIDNFKAINDTKGHLFGDEILIASANRLRGVFHAPNHTIYRIGGDEFLVISKNVNENELIDRLLELRKTEHRHCDFQFSKGYSAVAGSSAKHFNTAFDHADKMLYADKNSKKINALV